MVTVIGPNSLGKLIGEFFVLFCLIKNNTKLSTLHTQENMVENETVQPAHVQHQMDDEDDSESSNHDTDTSSCSKVNNCNETSYTDANKELLQAMKGADRSVLCWRVIVRILMTFVAVLLTTLTYVKLSESEAKVFEASVCTFVIPDDFRSWYATTNAFTVIYISSTDRQNFSSNSTVMNCFTLLATSSKFLPNHWKQCLIRLLHKGCVPATTIQQESSLGHT